MWIFLTGDGGAGGPAAQLTFSGQSHPKWIELKTVGAAHVNNTAPFTSHM